MFLWMTSLACKKNVFVISADGGCGDLIVTRNSRVNKVEEVYYDVKHTWCWYM